MSALGVKAVVSDTHSEQPGLAINDILGAIMGVQIPTKAVNWSHRPTAPRSPLQNSCVERTIGSIRCELLDHVIVTGERHLRYLFRDYADYHNNWRTHLGLGKATPLTRPDPP